MGATPITLRLPPDYLSALDRWIAVQDDEISRPEAVRRLMVKALSEHQGQ